MVNPQGMEDFGSWITWLKRLFELDSPAFLHSDIIGPSCCDLGGAGLRTADELFTAALSWYGCGDNSTTDNSAVINYGTGPDGVFKALAVDTETSTPGTVGTGVSWGLAKDVKSFAGFDKVPISTFDQTPSIRTTDVLSDILSSGFTVNMWIKYSGRGEIDLAGGGDSYRGTAWYSFFDGGSHAGLAVMTPTGIVNHGDPAPAASLVFKVTDGSVTKEITAAGALDGSYHMVTATLSPTGTMNLYVDGVWHASGSFTGTIPGQNTQAIGMGSSSPDLDGGSHNGLIDEVGVWLEVLNGSDILNLFNG